jgi:hypothetical protein
VCLEYKLEYLLNNAFFLLGLAQPAEKDKKKREEKVSKVSARVCSDACLYHEVFRRYTRTSQVICFG